MYKVTCLYPLKLTIADSNDKKIYNAVVKDEELNDKKTGKKYIQKGNVVIDAIPKSVTIYDSPVDKNRKLEIKFESRSSKKHFFTIGPGNIHYILDELQNRNMIIKKAPAMDALTAIVGAFERDDKAVINDSVTTPGYYLIDGNKIVAYDITQNIDKYPERKDILECIELLDELATRKYKNKDIFPTVIKWTVVAPFGYILKSLGNWMPGIHLYGYTRAGKTTLGTTMLAVWRKHSDKVKKDYHYGFSNIDSVARLGNVVSKSTYPFVVDEVGGLSDKKYIPLVEMLKHAIQNVTGRGKYIEGSYINIPALSNPFFTGNPTPPADPAYRTRFIQSHFGREESHDEEEGQKFKNWLFQKQDILGVLGDFSAKYVIDHPNETVLDENKTWRDISKTILSEFYRAADREPSEWIDYMVAQDVLGDTSDETYFELRAFFMDLITETHNRHYRTLTPFDREDPVVTAHFTIEQRLAFCLQNNLIPFLHRHVNNSVNSRDNQPEIVITSDVFVELNKIRRIENISHLRDLAHELKFEYCQKSIAGRNTKVVCGKEQDFINFLESKIEPSEKQNTFSWSDNNVV